MQIENYNYLNVFNNFPTYDNFDNIRQYDSQSTNIFSPINLKININIVKLTNNPQTNINFLKNANLNISNKEYNTDETNISIKKTLVLDLDETLVHSSMVPFPNKSNIILRLNIDGNDFTIYVIKRPYLDE